MTHCKDCWHYSPGDRKWGECDRTYSKGGDPLDKASLAYACDAEHFRATLEVHEDFGCIQFEPKHEGIA